MELGVGTLAYGIVAGVIAALGLAFGVVAISRRRADRELVAFAVMGATGAVNAVVTVRLQKSTTTDEYAFWMKVFGFAGLFTLISLVALVSAWTRGVPRRLMRVFAAASAAVAVLQMALPEGLLATDITGLREVSLLGEVFVVHEAGTSPWRPVLDAYLLLSLIAIASGLLRARRGERRSEAIVLAVGVAFIALVALYDSLVDEGLVSTAYLAPFGMLALGFLGAWRLAMHVADTERRLERQTIELEETVLDRTAALIDANRRLERQVGVQRVSAGRLATLTEQFECVNALTLHHDDRRELAASLGRVLHDLGQLVGASEVTLSLDALDDQVALADSIRWPGPVERADEGTDDVVAVEQLSVGGRALGELVVRSERGGIHEEQLRYVELTADHLAGFVSRVELADHIAATAVVSERHRLARELHDSVTQKLYSASFLAEAASNQLAEDPVSADSTVRRVREILLTSLAELRALMFELHPEALATATLPQLIAQLSESFEGAGTLRLEPSIGSVARLPTDVRVGLYRIAQESVSNAARHSGAAVARVCLRPAGGGVELEVSDDGCGFDVGVADVGHGLRNMRARAEAIGADLSVESAPGAGTRVLVRWLPGASDDHERAPSRLAGSAP